VEGVRVLLGLPPAAQSSDEKQDVPLPFAEYRLCRWMRWDDIDLLSTHRVIEAFAFMNLDIERENMADEGSAGMKPGGATR